MDPNARFHVERSGFVVRLFGALSANANLRLLDQMKRADGNVFDLRGLTSASWEGLVALHKYFEEFEEPLALVGIPRAVFRCLRLLRLTNPSVSIVEFEIELFDPADPERPATSMYIQASDLQQLAIEQGPILTLEDKRQLLGIVEHIVPLYFTTASLAPPLFQNSWCLDNNAEALFWFSLCHYAESTLGLALSLIETSRHELQVASHTLHARMRSIEACAAALSAAPRDGIADKLLVQCVELDRSLAAMLASMDPAERAVDHNLRAVQLTCWSAEADNPKALLDAVSWVADAAATVNPNTGNFALSGHAFIAACEAAQIPDELAGIILGLPPTECTEELAAKLRDAFFIMDPMCEGDWSQSIAAVVAELGGIAEDARLALSYLAAVERGQVLLTAWTKELRLVRETLVEIRRGSASWRELASLLEASWRSSETTSEQQHLRRFFFPEPNAEALEPPTAA